MAEEKNFIEEIIDSDLAQGNVSSVMTRFPPEPNGYLHIGHAKAICLNFGLAKKYNGKCNLRFDDTNPAKEDVEYIESIQEDIQWLGFSWDNLTYGSDDFQMMYECAVELIRKGLAYVDDLTAEQMRDYRGTLTEPGKNSPFRGRSIEENLDLFERMKAGEFEDGEKVLRAKIDMASPNLNMRDPALFRIASVPHHRTGTAWVIYPMYDMAHPLEDAVEGITHSLCTMEFEDHRPLYDWVIENCGSWKTVPHQYEFARLAMTHTVLSKRHLKKLVDDGVVSGWDDPRMPTISGLRARGYTPFAIRDFCERIGVAKANSTVDIRLLEHCVREDLGANAKRVMAVLRPLKLTIENYPDGKTEMLVAEDLPGSEATHEVPFSKNLYIEQDDFMEVKPNNKYFRLSLGGEVRLKNAYIIKCERVVKDETGNITEVICTYDETTKSGGENSGRKVKGTLHWADRDSAVSATARLFDYLFVEGEEEGKYVPSENSVEILEDIKVEPEILKAKPGERFQFLRQGYFNIDCKDTKDGALVFNRIVSLKDSFAKTMK